MRLLHSASTASVVWLWTAVGWGLFATAWQTPPPVGAPVGAPVGPSEGADESERLFATRVLPLLKARCWSCHGEEPGELRGGLDLRTLAAMRRGGDSGQPAVVAGHPDRSPLLLAATREASEWSAMPPKENDRLSAAEVAELRRWIQGGAPWPRPERIRQLATAAKPDEGKLRVATSGGLSVEWTERGYAADQLWAYQPLPEVPAVMGTESAGGTAGVNLVDRWIDQGLAAVELAPAPAADRRTLIRRATFDLLGLPPTPAEIEAFVADPADDEVAFSRLVERLLDSPHYGERWGRHWLDVVRYADSSGLANDYERGNAWRYRDYVVRSFQSDKPYDRFIIEQLAGDELDSTDPELLVAVGFLRMGPWELTGMEVARVARQRFLDDVTDAVGQVFLGHMLQCARCHDHKFDPVPTRDYYALQAVFATTQLAERAAAFLEVENTGGFEERKYLEARRRTYQAMLSELDGKRTVEAGEAWLLEAGRDPEPFRRTLARLRAAGRPGGVGLAEVRRAMAAAEIHPDLIPPRHAGFSPRDFGLERVARKGLERLVWREERYEPYALSVYTGPTPSLRSVNSPLRLPERPEGEWEATRILRGGDPFARGEAVQPGVLSVIQRGAAAPPFQHAGEPAGRRLALARWIADARNPLTARVLVNRVWHWHFGVPLAGNPNNFGATGKRPTHPQLLDELAARFIHDGWSIKSLHRLLMNSRAYRRSAEHPAPERLAERDPDGTRYAAFRPRRLEAEELRDAILSVSGELNPAVGGIPVRPEMNLEAALQPRMVMGTFAEAWQPSPQPAQRHRRSLYALQLRGHRDPFLEVFNAPAGEQSCERREASTVTPQVLTLFNSPLSFDRALAMARRLATAQPPQAAERRREIVRQAFLLAYGRPVAEAELAAAIAHWERMTARHQHLRPAERPRPRSVQRTAVEENTGEKFNFEEPLEVYEDFVPDLQPAEASADLRGLAELCLVLINSNEFVYVY